MGPDRSLDEILTANLRPQTALVDGGGRPLTPLEANAQRERMAPLRPMMALPDVQSPSSDTAQQLSSEDEDTTL